MFTGAFAATSALYLHHERSTQATVEADCQNRELCLDKTNLAPLGRFNDGTLWHGVTQEKPNVNLTGTLTVTGATVLSNNLTLSLFSTGRIPYTTTAGLLTSGTGLTYDGTTFSVTGTAAISGVTTFTAAPVFSSATASQAMFTNGSKALVSNAITGSGNVVMSASPTLTGTMIAANATFGGLVGITAASGDTYAGQMALTLASNNYHGAGFQISSTNDDYSEAVLLIKKTAGALNGTNGSYLLVHNGTSNLFRIKSDGAVDIASSFTSSDITCTKNANETAALATFLNPNTGSANFAKLTIGQSASNYVTLQYAGTGFITSGNLVANQGLIYLPSNAVGGFLLRGDANAPFIFSPNNTEALRLTSSLVTITPAVTMASTLGVTGIATFNAIPVFSSATASTAAAFDASKNLISVANTGTGNNVLSASPTLTGTIAAANQTLSGTLGVTGITTATGGLTLGASFVDKTTSITSITTLTSAHSTIFANATGGAFTITLPTAVGNTGLTYKILKNDVSTNTVTIGTTASQTIGGYSAIFLAGNLNMGIAEVISNGSNWLILRYEDSGFFTYTEATGVALTPTATAFWNMNSSFLITILFNPVAGTGNSTGFTLTGLPTYIRPASDVYSPVILTDNGTMISGLAYIGAGTGTITLSTAVATGTPVTYNSAGFTAAGDKRIGNSTGKASISYNVVY